MLERKVKEFCVREHLLSEGERVLLGLSGGMDSMCLLHILASLREEIPFSLEAAHLHHGIRGAAADEDETFCRCTCEALGIPFHAKRVDVPSLAKERRMGIEECGREERYRFFRSLGADKIAVAHHGDDQAETVLLHLLRGSGADGLSGMRAKHEDVIRPLLFASRIEIEEYRKAHHILWREDETNSSSDYDRNFLRHSVLPLLEHLRPGAAKRVASCAEKIREDNDYLCALADEKYACVHHGDARRSAPLAELLNMARPIRRRVMKKMLDLSGGFIGEALICDAEELLSGETGKQITLPGGFVAERSYDNFVVRAQGNPVEFSCRMRAGEALTLPDGRRVFLGEEGVLCVDSEKIPPEFSVRTRKPGDVFTPTGMCGRKKVKDFLMDEKIPREARENVLIFEHEDEIFCVYPYRVSDRVKVTDETKKVLKIKVKGQE